MRFLNHKLLLGILLCYHIAHGQLETPPAPFWHFAVRTTDRSSIMVIFSKDWRLPGSTEGIPISWFSVHKSEEPSLMENSTVLSGNILDLGKVYMAMDVPWSGPTAPYYWVTVRDSEGNQVSSSQPKTPLENEGAIFVTMPANAAAVETEECGDLATAPCYSIKTAVQKASDGSTIYVAPGSYSGINNTNISFNGKSLKLQSTNGMNVTMINCTNPETGERTRAFTFENGEGRGAVIQGFTITGGSADRGGCMHIINGSPTISECLFFDCRATTGIAWGGAIYSYGNPDPGPLINNTAFIYNWATEGAGVYIGGNSKMTIDNSLFEWGISPSATGRGGGICSDVANVTVTNTRLLNNNVGFGGGAVMLERSTGVFDRVSFFNNSAGSFGGAVLLFGADMKISNSELTYNKGLIFAGGVIITSSSYEAFNTIHNHNYGRGSGGAVQLVGGKLRLKQCQMNDNLSGGDGAGLFITNQKELGAVFTDAVVEESEIMNNIAKRRSGGFHFDAYDRILFREVMVANNTAERGGGGGCDAGSQSPSNFESVIFDNNRASIGGGMYLAAPCKMNFTTSIFRRNNAIDAGAGLAISDGVEVEISRSLFDQNGSPLCGTDDIPNIGGGLMIGVEEFDVNGQCNITGQTEISTINIRNSSIVGNFAKESGGGILIRQGQLNLQEVEIMGNTVVGKSDRPEEGIGGGLAIEETCPDSGPCSKAIVSISKCSISNNEALAAGGGLFFDGGSEEGGLFINQSILSGNQVRYNMTDGNAVEGVGGAAFIGRSNSHLKDIFISENKAYYGGGLFIGTSLSPAKVSFSKINATGNIALLGSSVFWLRSLSLNHSLSREAFNIFPEDLYSISTEVLKLSYESEPPRTAESGAVLPPFQVQMLDYYANIAISEIGNCKAYYPKGFDQNTKYENVSVIMKNETLSSSIGESSVQIRPLGSEVSVKSGEAGFSQLEISGTIGAQYGLEISCTSSSAGRSRFVQSGRDSLPPLSLPLELRPCPPGSAPKTTSTAEICIECPFNTYSFDGLECQTCPSGATCTGGSDISSRQNWWRSSNYSSEFYSCLSPNICEAGPKSGDEACLEGHEGPLCGVCMDDWFFFAGRCRSCDKSGISKAMLAFGVILIFTAVLLIFTRSWEFGDPSKPGLMAKIKILLAHFQVLGLLRDYDVSWPDATSEGFSWFDLSNFGLGMIAPSCFIGSSYSFWTKWIVQMTLPILAVAFCIAVYVISDWMLHKVSDKSRRHRVSAGGGSSFSRGEMNLEDIRENEDMLFVSEHDTSKTSFGQGEKLVKRLTNLKIRCWKNAFWLLTLMYPGCSMTALQMFATVALDIGTFLKADLSIMVRPLDGGYTKTYKSYLGPGALFLATFAIGIPALWWYTVWKHRNRLEEPEIASKFGFLYNSYKRRYSWWETVEALRKFGFAFIPVFVPANPAGSIQGVVGQIWAIAYGIPIVALRPFAQSEDNNLMLASVLIIWLVLVSGSAAKWASISDRGMKGLAAAQLILSSGLVFAIVTIIFFALWDKFRNRRSRAAVVPTNESNNSSYMDEMSSGKKFRLSLTQKIAKITVRTNPPTVGGPIPSFSTGP